jgi:hypothetical protein
LWLPRISLHPQQGEPYWRDRVVKEPAMCHLVREQQAGAAERGGATLPPGLDNRLRPRWVGAAAAVLIGGFAVAALVAPAPTSPLLAARESAAPAPLASRTSALPTAGGAEQGALPVDDGVPSSPDVAKAGIGHCHHGL